MALSSEDGFIRKMQGKGKSLSTGSTLLDRAFKIPVGQSLLINSHDSYAGGTAILLELMKTLLRENKNVFYVDPTNVFHSSQKHRWSDLAEWGDHFWIISNPPSVDDILGFALTTKSIPGAVWILDGINVMRQGEENGRWQFKYNLHDIVLRIRKMDPKATIIYAQNHTKDTPGLWASTVDLRIGKIDYRDGIKIGHTLDVIGIYGKTTVYVEYKRGRLSEAYQQAILEVENGKSMNSIFSLEEKSIRGFHEFVRQVNDELIGAYD